jgi:hypothetical protein
LLEVQVAGQPCRPHQVPHIPQMHLEMLVVILPLKAIREENIPAGRRPRTFTVVAQVEVAQVALDLTQ